MAMAMVSLPTRQPLVLPIAASTSYPRLNSQQFSSLRNQCGLSLDERCVRGGGSQRLVAVRASVGEAGLSVASGDVDAASGDAKFERVIGVLGRSRALDALDERVAQVDGNSGASVAVGESSALGGFRFRGDLLQLELSWILSSGE